MGLIHHLHFFFGVTIIHEDIDFRDAGLGNVVRIELWLFAFLAALQIVESFFAAARSGLIGRIDNALKLKGVIQRL